MLGLKTFPTQNKNLIFTGIGAINNSTIIFSWFDRISSLLKDKVSLTITQTALALKRRYWVSGGSD